MGDGERDISTSMMGDTSTDKWTLSDPVKSCHHCSTRPKVQQTKFSYVKRMPLWTTNTVHAMVWPMDDGILSER